MNGEIRFGLIGCGKISARHAREMVKRGKLVAVCDIDKNKADELANTYRTKACYDFDELIEKEKQNIDLLSICTPNGLHAGQTVAALKNGYDVLCEKPLSISVSDAEKMIETAKQYERKLFVVKTTRFNKAVLALKKAIDNNSLGKIYSFQMNCFWNRTDEYYLKDAWRGTLSMDGGILFTQFSHFIDIVSWLFGEAENITGFRKNFAHRNSIEFEDTGAASLRMQNGILGGINWSINAHQKNMEVSLALFTEKGTVKLGGTYLNAIAYEMPDKLLDLEKSFTDNHANDYGFYQGSMKNHDKVYDNLIKSLESDTTLIAEGTDGLKTVQFIEAVYKNCPLLKS